MSRKDFEKILLSGEKEISDLIKLISKDVFSSLDYDSKSIDKLILEKIEEYELDKKISDTYFLSLPKIAGSLGGEIKNEHLMQSYFDKSWVDDGLTLTNRIKKANKEVSESVKSVIKKGIKEKVNISESVKDLKKIVDKKDVFTINKKLSNITKMTLGDKNTEREIRKFRNYISKFNDNNSPGKSKLKNAYERVLKAVESGNKDRIDKAIQNALNTKAKYRAEMIYRTESAHAYNQMFNEKNLRDDDVVAYKWNLVSNHELDQCDFFANQDVGLGAGIYKKGQSPSGYPPVHPNCMCYLTAVYEGEISSKALKKKYDINKGEEWLKSQSKDDQESIMGVGNRDKWIKGELDFKKAVKNYGIPIDIKKINPQVSKKIIF